MDGSLVLLPTYNERENFPRVLPRLEAFADALDVVLVIDDASPDGTGDLEEDLSRAYRRLSVLHEKGKEGLGPAYLDGFREALERGYAAFVTMDADLSHAPEDVPRLLSGLREAGVSVGSMHVPGGEVENWPRSRRLLSSAESLHARVFLRLPLSDTTAGFRAYEAQALREIDLGGLSSKGFVLQVEVPRRILDLPGARALEVPILLFRNRALGSSKLSGSMVLEAVLEVLRLAPRRRRASRRRYAPIVSLAPYEPTVSVVIPRRPEGPPPCALESLSVLHYPLSKLEVLVASGRAPSRQRNEAVRNSKGELILFLDDDSVVSPWLLERYLDAFRADSTLAAVGGPAESLSGNGFQRLSSLVLGEPWVMGKSAARYRAWGEARYSDERELILCNLCVRRRAFAEVGGFDEALYPNEENEFLERLRRRGWRSLYDPKAVVKRPYRRNLREFVSSIFGYGRGRAAQWKRLPSGLSRGRLALGAAALMVVLLTVAGPALGLMALGLPAALYAAYLAALGAKLALRSGARAALLAPVLGLAVHGSYSAGLLWGLVTTKASPNAGEVRVEIVKRALSPTSDRRVA